MILAKNQLVASVNHPCIPALKLNLPSGKSSSQSDPTKNGFYMKWYFAITEETLAHHDHGFLGLLRSKRRGGGI